MGLRLIVSFIPFFLLTQYKAICELTVWKYTQNRILKLPPQMILGYTVAARHFLVLLHFICMKISHGFMIYIIDEGSRSALQSLEQNFPWYAPPLPPLLRPPPPLFLSSLSPFLSPSICPPIGALFHPTPAAFHPSPALWSLIISSLHKSNLTSLYFHPSFLPSFTHSTLFP